MNKIFRAQSRVVEWMELPSARYDYSGNTYPPVVKWYYLIFSRLVKNSPAI
jgi:hypothetical protein